ncbi:shikimate-5-dehydrogenase [Aureobasidium pullulans]|uniref:Shikimate-5-dehydrogenase n=1 Tax=Aureobasidium pullulans TaxID=5580 RepID=A0A4S8SQF2_AURPU|nr:shikimate-5-dehydrogenase [Aureobasidium pullulans]
MIQVLDNSQKEAEGLQCYLLGFNIKGSFSPLLHNTGFKVLGLPHTYGLFEVPDVDDTVEKLLQDPKLGGLSVTVLHKLQVGKYMDEISEEANTMGSVNTIVAKTASGQRKLYGDNTDWLGITRCIQGGKVDLDVVGTTAVVLGAGGAARAAVYAFIKLGIQHIIVVNRTFDRAQKLAASFPDHNIEIVESLRQLEEHPSDNPLSISVIVGCLPAEVLDESDIPDPIFPAVQKGVLVEMAYGKTTEITKKAMAAANWAVFDGIDVLQQQAFGQFEAWTGKPAPRKEMMEAVNEALGRPLNPAFAEDGE